MSNTRSQLAAARIYVVDDEGKEKSSGPSVSCMFNPYEYSVSKSNSYNENPKNQGRVPHADFMSAGPQTLQLNLTFDTYETGTDVSLETNKLWKFMEAVEDQPEIKVPPPNVAFEWGVFRFVSVITNMSQKFTLFKPDGTPVRAKVDVTFTQYIDVNDYPKQNPTSGGGPLQRVRRVLAGDRLDTIASEVYGDATRWRVIADANNIRDPLALRPGQQLSIPPLE